MIRRTRAALMTPDAVLVVLLAAAGGVVALYGLGAPSIWTDEGVTWAVSETLPQRLLFWIQSHEANMLGYYFLVAGLERVLALVGVPVTEFVLRFPSAVAHPLAAVALYWAGRRRIGTLPALAAALAFLLMPGAVDLARVARAYSLQTLGVIVSWHAWMAIVIDRRSGWRWPVVYVLAAAFGCWMQLLTVVMVACQLGAAAGLVATRPELRKHLRSQLPPLGVAAGAAGLLVAPLLVLEAGFPNGIGWVPAPSAEAAVNVVGFLTGGSTAFFAIVAGGVVVWAASFFLDRKDGLTSLRVAAAAWAFGAPALMALVSVLPHSVHLFFPRYLAMSFPGIALGLGMAVRSLGSPGAAAAAVLIVLGAGGSAAASSIAQPPKEDYRSAVAWVDARWQTGDVAIVSPGYSLPAVLFYSSGRRGPQLGDIKSPAEASSLPSARRRVFVIVGPLAASDGERSDDIDAALRTRRLRLSGSATFAGSLGTTYVALYAR